MHWREIGAGDEVRTRDIQLGRLKLYQLSYSRSEKSGEHHPNFLQPVNAVRDQNLDLLHELYGGGRRI